LGDKAEGDELSELVAARQRATGLSGEGEANAVGLRCDRTTEKRVLEEELDSADRGSTVDA